MDGLTRLVVVAPHPDDEVLMAGGVMRRCSMRGTPVLVVAVTDGEGSHARSTCVTPAELRRWRADERDEALARLGVTAEIQRLGVSDQDCHGRTDAIATTLAPLLHRGDVVVTVSRADRHPDHVATATATSRAARGIVDVVHEAPTWALVHDTAPRPTCVLRLTAEEWAAKRHAVHAFRSQLEPLGPSLLDGPVVHPHELDRMLRPYETFTAVAP